MRYALSLSLSLALLIFCAGVCAAQVTKCSLRLEESPELRGLRLRMTAEQATARFKVIETEPVDEFGVERLRLDPGSDQVASEEVKDIALELIGERVVSIRLVYSPSAGANDQRELTERLSKSLRLPLAWKTVTMGNNVTGMMMECTGFKINASLIGGRIPVIYLVDLAAETILLRRQVERERRLRQFFRP